MFSIILPSLAIYLKDEFVPIEDDMYEIWLGGISAAHPAGQLIGSPLASWMFSHLRTDVTMTFFLSFFCVGALIYATASSAMMLLVSRFIQGFGDANLTTCRAYISHVSTEDEKIEHMSLTSAAQALGFLFGSVIGGLLSVCDFSIFGLPVNANTAPGFFSFLIGILNIAICVFYMKNYGGKKKKGKSATQHMPPSQMAIAASNLLFFFAISSFATVLAVTTIYLNENFGWESGGIAAIFAMGSLLGVCAFKSMKPLNDCIRSRTGLMAHTVEKILMCVGFSGAAMGNFLMGGFGITTVSIETWVIGVVLFFVMHPYAMACVLTLYSKVLGPLKEAQSTYMGYITMTGAAASIGAPLWATYILGSEDFRGSWTFFFTGLYMLFGVALIFCIWGLLKPHPQLNDHQIVLDEDVPEPANYGSVQPGDEDFDFDDPNRRY